MKTQRLSFLTSLFIIGLFLTALTGVVHFELDDYVGKYLHDDGSFVLITEEEGELYAEVMGRPKIKIEPAEDAEDVYVNETIGSSGVVFTFERASGEIESLTFEVDEASFTCQKTEE